MTTSTWSGSKNDTKKVEHSIFCHFQGYPYTRNRLLREAGKDIPPFYRGQIWAALLNVKGDTEVQYTAIDKETTTVTDRQVR